MRSLQERSKELSDSLGRIANRERDTQIVQNLRGIADYLNELITKTQKLAESISVLHSEHLLDGAYVSESSVSSLKDRIESLRRRIIETPEDVRSGNVWARFEREATALHDDTRRSIETTWRNHLNSQLTEITSLSVFGQVPACRSVLRKVEANNQWIRARMADLPTASKDVRETIELGKEAKKLVGKLNLQGVPEGVLKLLKNAATTGTPLEDLADDVLGWLREHPDFLRSLRITASSR